MSPPFHWEKGILTLHLRLTPRGGRDAFEGFGLASDGRAHALARVRAVPEDGAANAALIALLAKTLGVRKGDIEIAGGASARLKALRIADAAGGAAHILAQWWEKAALLD